MQTDEQPRRRSSLKKIKSYSKYCILLVVCCLSIIILPSVYLIYAFNTGFKSKANNQISHLEYKAKSGPEVLPWYMAKGVRYPKDKDKNKSSAIWPEEDKSDRIENQLMFLAKVNTSKMKTILIYNNHTLPSLLVGQDSFFVCPVSTCSVSLNEKDIDTADAVLFTDEQRDLPKFRNGSRPSQQVWILFVQKNPFYAENLDHFSGLINWTASYRSDSDLVTPYDKWVYYNRSVKELPEVTRNFADGKTKKVVWFVRDPREENNRRWEYVQQLMEYIDVDVFGNSEDYHCPCSSPKECFGLLSQYKFFVAFENSNCKDYITKKFFISLQRGVLPLVMGAPSKQYIKSAPRHSFIHVDDFTSPRHLAEYLHELDQDDDLYNAYFRWRGTGEMIDTRIECRLCALLHSGRHKTYTDVGSWFTKNACVTNKKR